jgi:hypothetical protein
MRRLWLPFLFAAVILSGCVSYSTKYVSDGYGKNSQKVVLSKIMGEDVTVFRRTSYPVSGAALFIRSDSLFVSEDEDLPPAAVAVRDILEIKTGASPAAPVFGFILGALAGGAIGTAVGAGATQAESPYATPFAKIGGGIAGGAIGLAIGAGVGTLVGFIAGTGDAYVFADGEPFEDGTSPSKELMILELDELIAETAGSVTIPWRGAELKLPRDLITIERRDGKVRLSVPRYMLPVDDVGTPENKKPQG